MLCYNNETCGNKFTDLYYFYIDKSKKFCSVNCLVNYVLKYYKTVVLKDGMEVGYENGSA